MKKFTNGFKAAFHGIEETFKQERNFKFMLVIAAGVLFLMFYFPTTKDEKVALLIATFFVLTLELMNSTIERIMNFLHPEPDERIKAIKDLTAGIVLVASLGAAIIGAVIFLPYLK